MLLWLYRIFLAVFLVFPGSAAVATPSGATDVLLQFRKICPTQAQPMLSMLGKYSPGEPDAVTLRDALGDIPREALIDRLNSLLGFTDRFGASSRWDRQIEVCSDAQLSEGHTSGCLDLDDTVFTLKLTPNLAHALSVYGIAREVAARDGRIEELEAETRRMQQTRRDVARRIDQLIQQIDQLEGRFPARSE